MTNINHIIATTGRTLPIRPMIGDTISIDDRMPSPITNTHFFYSPSGMTMVELTLGSSNITHIFYTPPTR